MELISLKKEFRDMSTSLHLFQPLLTYKCLILLKQIKRPRDILTLKVSPKCTRYCSVMAQIVLRKVLYTLLKLVKCIYIKITNSWMLKLSVKGGMSMLLTWLGLICFLLHFLIFWYLVVSALHFNRLSDQKHIILSVTMAKTSFPA